MPRLNAPLIVVNSLHPYNRSMLERILPDRVHNIIHNVVRGLQRETELHRVCFPSEVKNEVYRLYHELTPKDRSAVG